MGKRKREDEEGVTHGGGAKGQRVRYKIQHGTVKLGHAFKVAKRFERQKLGRRHKDAVKQRNEKNEQRINAEIAALKTLDTTACAKVYLSKVLLRIKTVSESPHLPEDVRKPATLSMEPAVLNVHARLCNSNPVKEALLAILPDIQNAMGIRPKQEAPVKKKTKRSGNASEEEVPPKEPKAAGVAKAQAKVERELSTSGDDDVGDAEHESMLGSDISDDDLARFDDRLASSDGEDEEGSDMDVEAIEKRLAAEGVPRKPTTSIYDHAADLSLSDAESETSYASPEPQKAKAPALKNSAFLPSLSMGGYISGSGSDIEDIDEPPKKNRRGQRARQQIWEKKFGAKAKHLQGPKAKEGRNAGWDPKRGAIDSGERRGKGGWRGEQPRGGPTRSGMPAQESKPKHRDDSGPIHPSWEAAKKAKDKKMAAPAAFEGKKIRFD